MSVTPTTLRERRAPSLGVLAIALLALIAALLAVIAVLLALDARDGSSGATVVGSGVEATEERTLETFSAIDLSGESALAVRVGGPQSVVVSADDNLVDRVTTTVGGEKLVVGTEGSFRTTSPMTVTVTVPSLDELELSGAGSVDAEGVRGERLVVTLSGDGLVRVTGRVEKLDVRLAGTGQRGARRARGGRRARRARWDRPDLCSRGQDAGRVDPGHGHDHVPRKPARRHAARDGHRFRRGRLSARPDQPPSAAIRWVT